MVKQQDPNVPPAPKFVRACVHLRCKSMYYTDVERPGLLHESEVMMYWCNHSQESIGCDGGDCDPHACQGHRECAEM